MEKCLVTEAMDKCGCGWCRVFREFRNDSILRIINEKRLNDDRKGVSVTKA